MIRSVDTSEFVTREVLRKARYLLLTVDDAGRLVHLDDPGGDWGIDGLQVGQPLPEALDAIIQLAPAEPRIQRYPMVYLGPSTMADVHVLAQDGSRQVVLWDVSKIHEIESKLQQKAHEISLLLEQQAELNRQLDIQRAEAERASQAKSRFIASMSHEFRTPITSIMGHVDLVAQLAPDSASPAAIERASWHLLALVENLLQQAQQDEGRVPINPAPVTLSSLLDDMQGLFSTQASGKGLEWSISRPATDITVETDELRLRQVLINLIGNAFRYTSKGSVQLSVESDGQAVRFTIADTGPGIAVEDQPRIFAPFARLDPEHGAGAGLGLTISRQLLEAMGAKLELDSTVGRGSRFSFELSTGAQSARPSRGKIEGHSVLLVDDDADIRALFEVLLSDWGMRVTSVSELHQARQIIEQQGFDLLLADFHLEDGSGADLLRDMRSKHPACQRILCSGSGQRGAFQTEADELAHAVVAKPVRPESLRAVIEQVLEQAG